MLDKKTLVDRLKEYNFSKHPNYPDTSYERPHGFKNMLTAISTYATMLTITDYDKENIETINEAYGFLASCYSSINFKELEENKDEPAVELLFKTNELLRNLGKAIMTFTAECVTGNKTKEKITPDSQSYIELQKTIAEISKLDSHGLYVKRIKELEKD